MENDKLKRKKRDFLKAMVAAVIVAAFTKIVLNPIVVVGGSMEPTFYNGDFIFCLRSTDKTIERGDIVIASVPKTEDENSHEIIKRVIGLPGDKIYCYDGYIYINDEKLDDYVDIRIDEENYGSLACSFVLGEDSYFLLGDNRNASTDSRWYGDFLSSDINTNITANMRAYHLEKMVKPRLLNGIQQFFEEHF